MLGSEGSLVQEATLRSVSHREITPLTPEELTELKEHIREGHLPKSHNCRACILGSGPIKYNRTLHSDDRMSHCLHVDLAGPFDQSVDCYKYFMVGILRLPDFPLLIQIELLETRGAPEMLRQLCSSHNLLRSFVWLSSLGVLAVVDSSHECQNMRRLT
eukprot:5945680-Amphidinium_carterae.1